ncbi:hypothetical protein [Gemmobacter caeni]|jgi:hypothetical protein|nr:hypothetical protein [Gemmobacter caeni]
MRLVIAADYSHQIGRPKMRRAATESAAHGQQFSGARSVGDAGISVRVG